VLGGRSPLTKGPRKDTVQCRRNCGRERRAYVIISRGIPLREIGGERRRGNGIPLGEGGAPIMEVSLQKRWRRTLYYKQGKESARI